MQAIRRIRDFRQYGLDLVTGRACPYGMRYLFRLTEDGAQHVREFLGMCAREYSDKKVIAVTHGEVMWATRFVLERLMPHEWQELDEQEDQRITNCSILQYTRLDPHGSGEVATSLSSGWRRITDPIAGNSPDNGEWRRIPGKRALAAAEIMAIVNASPRLL